MRKVARLEKEVAALRAELDIVNETVAKMLTAMWKLLDMVRTTQEDT